MGIVAFSVNADEAIMDFIAISVISDLDEKYFIAIKDPLKDKLIKEQHKIPITS